MPITDAEFERGERVPGEAVDGVAPAGDHGTGRELVLTFLERNPGQAFTRNEIVRGVDFDADEDPDRVLTALDDTPAETPAVADDLAASVALDDDAGAVLAELLDEGRIERRAVATDDGGTVDHYRIDD